MCVLHSTELAVLELIDGMIVTLDKGEKPVNIFLDIYKKTFDALDHTIGSL